MRNEGSWVNFSPIKVVCFDAVDTLFRVRGSVGQVYARVAEAFGAQREPEAINRAFAEVFAQAPPPAFPGTPADQIAAREERYWYQIVQAVFERVGPIPGFDVYFRSVFDAFRRAETWELFPDTPPVLAHLRKAGVRLGVISNFDSRIYEVFEALGLKIYIDEFFLSTRVGAAKPDRRLFQAATDHFGCAPTEALFVGDTLREDMAGAAAAGLVPVLIDRAQRHASVTDFLRITDLYPLRDWIGPR